MQQHPVPQNIIGFQFKLVGDMTLKQFGYLAGGALAAFLTTKLPYPSIFTYPVAGLLAFLGFGLAFLPIEDRPMDIWIKNFFLAIFSPTQFVYKKVGGDLSFLNIDLARSTASLEIVEKSLKEDRYQDFLKTLGRKDTNIIDVIEKQYLRSIDYKSALPAGIQPFVAPPPRFSEEEPSASQISPSVVSNFQPSAFVSLADIARNPRVFENIKVRPLSQEVKGEIVFQTDLPQTKTPEETATSNFKPVISSQNPQFQAVRIDSFKTTLPPSPPTEKIKEFDKGQASRGESFAFAQDLRLKQIAKRQKEEAEKRQKEKAQAFENLKEIETTQRKIGANISAFQHQTKTNQPVVSARRLSSISSPQTPKTPNIVTGVIIDKDEKPVVGAIVEIKDALGLTHRTMKTNLIGQFGIATPLLSGIYTLYIEKEGLIFDIIEIVLDNKIIEPILIKAKP